MSGYFEAMRRTHPVKLGEIIDGKRVVATFWQWTPENGNVPMYRLQGEANGKNLDDKRTQEHHSTN
jgi:hypothetical protein